MDDLATFDGALELGGDYDRLRFDGVDLSGQHAEDARFIECAFVSCDLDGAHLDHSLVLDTTVTAAIAGTLALPDATLQDVTLSDCRVGALVAHGSRVTRVVVRGGKFDYVNLRGSRLDDVRLVGCVIGALDLAGATVTRLVVQDCRVDQLDLTSATMTATDLRGAELSTLTGLAGLAGTTISREQLHALAPALAAHLRITVE